MESVMISIQPIWCSFIASGTKTIEVRKTKPKIDVPFKCYIYCTSVKNMSISGYVEIHRSTHGAIDDWHGKVIGEFVCRNADEYPYSYEDGVEIDDDLLLDTMMDREDINVYAKGKTIYGWYISDLVIYDKPKRLSKFIAPRKFGCVNEAKCAGCRYLDRGNGFNVEDDCNAPFCTDDYKPMRQPPNSWCYVEELDENT